MQAILSILLATFAGFGIAMSGSSILVEFYRWRRQWRAQLDRHDDSQLVMPPNRRPQTAVPSQLGPLHPHPTDVENPETFSGN